MRAQAFILTGGDRREDFTRWSLAAALVVAAHFGLVATYLLMPEAGPQGAPPAIAVIIDLAPPAAPPSQQDITPGPEQEEVTETIPKPMPQVEPKIEPPPVETRSEIVVPQPEPKPAEVKPVEKPPEKKIEKRPTSRASAAPRSDHTAERPSAPSPGSEATRPAVANWRDQVRARLQSVKRCPSGASGTVTVGLNFTVDRGGGLVGRSIYRSSGNSAFDQEALAMVSRAAPFPAVPAGQPTPVHLPIPINFTCR